MSDADFELMWNFKRGEHGELVFYPRGVFGRGYVVPDPQRAEAIVGVTATADRLWGIAVVFVYVINLWLVPAVLIVSGAQKRWQLRSLLADLEPSDERLSIPDQLRKLRLLLLLEALSTSWVTVFAIIGVGLAMMSPIAGVPELGTFACAVGSWILWVKLRAIEQE